MQNSTFESVKDFERGAFQLGKRQPKFLDAISLCGLPEIRITNSGFKALFKIIVGQQLSTASANSIWKKLEDNHMTEIDSVLSAEDSQLRSLGLSASKVSYVRGLAVANINYESLIEKSNSDIIEELIAVRGIGLWTAQIYLMFSLRRSDVFAPGDLALQEGARNLLGLKNRPSSDELNILSQGWKPYRTIAAMIIWNYYGYVKKKE